MRITIAAVGKLKAGPDRELQDRYLQRSIAAGRAAGLTGFELIELPEGKASEREARMTDEAGRLLTRTAKASTRILLDERGKALTSQQFAAELRRLRDGGDNEIAFLLGGPDGHGEPARAAARWGLSLSAMTLPHGLARIVLAEQFYRAITILTGHPYHRD